MRVYKKPCTPASPVVSSIIDQQVRPKFETEVAAPAKNKEGEIAAVTVSSAAPVNITPADVDNADGTIRETANGCC